MIAARITYADALRAVAAGNLVVFAAGTIDDAPALAWYATPLAGEYAARAYSRDQDEHAGLAIGVIFELRRIARHQGFKPV